MKDRDEGTRRKPFAGTNLVREVSYVHEDEAARALDERARKERTAKSEIIRALGAYLGIED